MSNLCHSVAEQGHAWEELLAAAVARQPESAESQTDREAEREARLEWIEKRWPPVYACEVCGSEKWRVSDPGEIGPQVLAYPVTCRYCGNTKLLVPSVADLDEPEESDV